MSFTQSASPPVNISASPSIERRGRVPGPVSTRKAMAISFGSRPAFSAKPCMRARPVLKRLTVFIGNCGFVPTGYQPWAYLTVRRSAGPLSPPTQIGIGFCTGLGVNTTSSNFTYLPENFGNSAVQSSLQAAIHSSVTCPRSSNGAAPIASNSSRHQPTPIPSVSRPLDRKSIVDSSLAVSTAGRCGTTMTESTKRSFVVNAAT